MSLRIQSAVAVAILQRRTAAGITATLRLSGSTTASSRTRSSPPQPPGPLMSGIEGAIAMSSVSASRQADGGAGSAGFSGSGFSADSLSGSALFESALGASAGRGRGRGMATWWRLPRSFGLPAKRSRGGIGLASRAAAGTTTAQNASAAAVTIAAPGRSRAPISNFRLDFSALQFMTIPNLTATSPVLWGESGKDHNDQEGRSDAWFNARLAVVVPPDYREPAQL